MYDLPPDAARLRVVVRQLTIWLGRAREALAAAEELERQRAEEAPRESSGPGYKLEAQRVTGSTAPWRVHVGDCGLGKGRACSAGQAREALAAGVEACAICRPDTALGLLDLGAARPLWSGDSPGS